MTIRSGLVMVGLFVAAAAVSPRRADSHGTQTPYMASAPYKLGSAPNKYVQTSSKTYLSVGHRAMFHRSLLMQGGTAVSACDPACDLGCDHTTTCPLGSTWCYPTSAKPCASATYQGKLHSYWRNCSYAIEGTGIFTNTATWFGNCGSA